MAEVLAYFKRYACNGQRDMLKYMPPVNDVHLE